MVASEFSEVSILRRSIHSREWKRQLEIIGAALSQLD